MPKTKEEEYDEKLNEILNEISKLESILNNDNENKNEVNQIKGGIELVQDQINSRNADRFSEDTNNNLKEYVKKINTIITKKLNKIEEEGKYKVKDDDDKDCSRDLFNFYLNIGDSSGDKKIKSIVLNSEKDNKNDIMRTAGGALTALTSQINSSGNDSNELIKTKIGGRINNKSKKSRQINKAKKTKKRR